MSQLARKLGKKISELRRRGGLTSEKLAYESGVSKGYLSDVENGRRLPSLKFLEKLAKSLEVEIRDFF